MDIKILAQNIVNNPNDFTAEQIENLFKEYANQSNSVDITDEDKQRLSNWVGWLKKRLPQIDSVYDGYITFAMKEWGEEYHIAQCRKIEK